MKVEHRSLDGTNPKVNVYLWNSDFEEGLDKATGLYITVRSSSWTEVSAAFSEAAGFGVYFTLDMNPGDRVEATSTGNADVEHYCMVTTVSYEGVGTDVLTDFTDTRFVTYENRDTTIDVQIPATAITGGEGTFRGYATTPNGVPEYQPGQTIPVDAGDDLTLYAIWELDMFTVNFYADYTSEGEITEEVLHRSVQVRDGGYVALPTTPDDYDGAYVFQGWYTDKGAWEDVFDGTEPITADVNVYGHMSGDLSFTEKPIASQTVRPIAGAPGTLMFSAAESEYYRTVHWDFGDGDTSDSLMVTHHYDEPGTYDVTLTLTNALGTTTVYGQVTVPGGDSDDGTPWALYVGIVAAVVVLTMLVVRSLL